ncbi:hypothetical protein KIN20_009055 [Parelaphostrongylus tenuis]|uniref:Uncharacterized protein n=1 Tax=Parelaphostrongylus tenuis TaxID=148309 RepID=A0AAD5MNK7_PARTN|nr:hypothetical protein KIN20_009055 [Parelaphostrongylus tenuis]
MHDLWKAMSDGEKEMIFRIARDTLHHRDGSWSNASRIDENLVSEATKGRSSQTVSESYVNSELLRMIDGREELLKVSVMPPAQYMQKVFM